MPWRNSQKVTWDIEQFLIGDPPMHCEMTLFLYSSLSDFYSYLDKGDSTLAQFNVCSLTESWVN